MKHMSRIMPVLIALIFIFGCSAPVQKPEAPDIVWPLPPDKPRIKYLTSYNNTFDVEGEPGFFDKLAGVDYYSLEAPQGVAADREGNIYAADSTRHVIVVFRPGKKKLEFIGGSGAKERALLPVGLAIANNSKVLLVASAGAKKIIGYDLDTGDVKLVITGFLNPVGVAVDEARARIYVTDSKASNLTVFDISGRYISTLAKQGGQDNELATPTQVAVDQQGNIYVADLFNFSIKVFSPEGAYVKKIGHGPCTGMGCFSKLNGVALDSDNNIYAVDTDFGNVQIFNQKGEFLLPVAGIGTGPDKLALPMQIYIDEKDRIYVADTYNFSIKVYQYLGDAEKNIQPAEQPK